MEFTFGAITQDLKNWVWLLGDGRYWGTKLAMFINEDAAKKIASDIGLGVIPSSPPDKFGECNTQGLVEALKFYGLPLGELTSLEDSYGEERAAINAKYLAPWDGITGGILVTLQMTILAAQCEVPQNPEKIASIGASYQAELAAMRAEFQTIDEKYGV